MSMESSRKEDEHDLVLLGIAVAVRNLDTDQPSAQDAKGKKKRT